MPTLTLLICTNCHTAALWNWTRPADVDGAIRRCAVCDGQLKDISNTALGKAYEDYINQQALDELMKAGD